MAAEVTVSKKERTKGVGFILHKAEEARPECLFCSQRRAVGHCQLLGVVPAPVPKSDLKERGQPGVEELGN